MILIGKQIIVTHATNPEQIGLRGTVLEEGRDTLRVQTTRGEKLLVKHTITIDVDGKSIEGTTLRGTHAARMKK